MIIKIVGSVVQAQSAISDGVSFDAAIVDLHLADGDGSRSTGFYPGGAFR